MSEKRNEGRLLPVMLVALLLAWMVMGWQDLDEASQAGFDTDGNHTVTRVLADSPAAAAGLQRGDVIRRIERIDSQDTAAIARLPRARPGDVRVYTVLRDGEEQVVPIRYGPLLPRTLAMSRASAVIGLCFLLFPLLAWIRHPSDATRILSVMGFGLSLAFVPAPYIAEASIRAITTTVTTVFVLAGVAALLQFLLVFPRKRPWLNRPLGKRLLYLPALLLWAVLAFRILWMPPASTALNVVTNLLAGVVVGGYLLAALYLVLRNYSRTDRAERKRLALNGMIWGTVLGLLPATVAQLVDAFSPASALPGQDYYFASLVLIPLSWSRSASRPAALPARMDGAGP